MKILAIDTATEQCSVALLDGARVVSRCVPMPRGHADVLLSMVQDVMNEAGATLPQLQAIAFGRGPGAFTGVRIAIGAAQGMALALGIPLLPISNLAAVAQQAAAQVPVGSHVLVCMDARMGEIYSGDFVLAADGLVEPVAAERLVAPDRFSLPTSPAVVPVLGLGTGFRAYPVLRERCAGLTIDDTALPRASDIVQLAARDFARGMALPAAVVQPVYLRDDVVHVKVS